MTQEQTSQKAKCPFCQMVAGEIPVAKVYEDDKCLAILDINPVAKGHVLLFPKEHYPFFATLPPQLVSHLGTTAKYICQGLKKTVVVDSVTCFVANGAHAGQTVAHAMIHIIPREQKDGLFQLPSKTLDAKQQLAITDLIQNHFKAKINPVPEEQKKKIAQYLSDETVQKELIQNPIAFEEKIKQNKELSEIFKGINIQALAKRLSGDVK
jgi:diadenosine tetraphosphate (Ap4A) HIT family hydrolase